MQNNKIINKQNFQQFWHNSSKEKRDIILINFLYTKFCKTVVDEKARYSWLFILENIIKKEFYHSSFSLDQNVIGFSKFFYKKIRKVQDLIVLLKSNIAKLDNLKLLENTSQDLFISSWNSITLFNLDEMVSDNEKIFDKSLNFFFSKNDEEFNNYLNIKEIFGMRINLANNTYDLFKTYVCQLYLKLYELEEKLQWFNWVMFYLDVKDKPYNFYKSKALTFFFNEVNTYGYLYWHKNTFNTFNTTTTQVTKIKLKKKWRFWRNFKRTLLFEKSHIFIKFKWLFNHKQLLSHQYISTYSIRMQTKLKQIYKKKISRARLFNYLINFEYRIDILVMRIFNIKSIKLVWLLLYFGFLTINFNKKKKNYILQKGDLIFGWFLLKNYSFFRKLQTRFYKPKKLYSFLEYEASINSFICLSLPVKYLSTVTNQDRLMSKRFIKYTYLKTY